MKVIFIPYQILTCLDDYPISIRNTIVSGYTRYLVIHSTHHYGKVLVFSNEVFR